VHAPLPTLANHFLAVPGSQTGTHNAPEKLAYPVRQADSGQAVVVVQRPVYLDCLPISFLHFEPTVCLVVDSAFALHDFENHSCCHPWTVVEAWQVQ
jgi:hypothetical protein